MDEQTQEKPIEIKFSSNEQEVNTNPLEVRGEFNYKYTYGALFLNLFNKWIQVSPKYKIGSSSRTISSGTGTQVISGIGFYPRKIIINSFASANNGSTCTGKATGTTGILYTERYLSGSNWSTTQGASYIISVRDTLGNVSQATISDISFDSFTINWSSMAVDCYFTWEASN